MRGLCFGFGIALFVSVSPAAEGVASLPPLPAELLADSAREHTASAWPSVGEPPLGGEEADAIEDVSGDMPSTVAGAPNAPATGPATSGAGVSFPSGPPVPAPAPVSALEGPPVPLAPAARMSDESALASAAAGNAPDERPITMRFKNAELADVLDAFSRFTGLNIVASVIEIIKSERLPVILNTALPRLGFQRLAQALKVVAPAEKGARHRSNVVERAAFGGKVVAPLAG